MKKLALFGGPGAGKTTCASGFSAHMNSLGFPFYHVPEYARTFIDTHGAESIPSCGPLLQLKFITKQRQREEEVPDGVFGYITDCPTFLSWIYASYYGDSTVASYIARKDCYKEFLRGIYRYDRIFKVVREYEYVEDGCRVQSEADARMLDDAIGTTLKLHGVNYIELKGSVEDRIKTIYESVEW